MKRIDRAMNLVYCRVNHSGTVRVWAFVYIEVNTRAYPRTAGHTLNKLKPSSSVSDVINRPNGKYIRKVSPRTNL